MTYTDTDTDTKESLWASNLWGLTDLIRIITAVVWITHKSSERLRALPVIHKYWHPWRQRPRVKEFLLCATVFECVTVSHSCPSLVWKSFNCVLLCLSVLLCLIPVLASCERVSTVFECVTVSHSCPSLVWKSFYCVWVCYCVSFLS